MVRREAGRAAPVRPHRDRQLQPTTARLYTDLSLLTARADLAEDVAALFNMLTANTTAELAAQGLDPRWPWKQLAVAPHGLQERMLKEIRGRGGGGRAPGEPARILAKMNSLVDREVIPRSTGRARPACRWSCSCAASAACGPACPASPSASACTRWWTRYLEHSRVFVFGEGKRARFYISSADWMPRNFHSRVEVTAPIEDPEGRQRLLQILEAGLADTAKGRVLRPGGARRVAGLRARARRGRAASAARPRWSGRGPAASRPSCGPCWRP